MANMMDYLDWRGDLSFEQDPFNAVDNLILSEMVYTDLDGIVPAGQTEEISIADACAKVFEAHTREELLAKESFIKMAPFVMEKMKDTVRFGSVTLCGYVNYIDEKTEAQMAVLTCRLGDGSVYVAFRGTDDTVVGWKEDFNLSFMSETEGQRRAAAYLNEQFQGQKVKIRVGGHSKGGNFAVYASAFAKKSIRRKITEIYTNDGPGFRPEVTQQESYREMLPKIISTVPESTIVSVLLENDVHHHVVKSSASGIMQHDAITWQILGNRFVEAEGRDESSRFFDTTMRNWLGGLPDEERESFVGSLFSLLKATGAETLEDIGRDPFRSGSEIIKSIRNMDKAQQEEFRRVIGKLLKSGQESVAKAAKEKLGIGQAAAPKQEALPEPAAAKEPEALTDADES